MGMYFVVLLFSILVFRGLYFIDFSGSNLFVFFEVYKPFQSDC